MRTARSPWAVAVGFCALFVLGAVGVLALAASGSQDDLQGRCTTALVEAMTPDIESGALLDPAFAPRYDTRPAVQATCGRLSPAQLDRATRDALERLVPVLERQAAALPSPSPDGAP